MEKGSLPLMFKPTGKPGQANISITLETEEKKKATVQLELLVKSASTISLTTFKEIHTGEEEKITLNISSRDPNEEFIIQFIKPGDGEVEVTYASGEYVHLGDKLKPGVHQFTYKIHRRDHIEPVITLDGYTTYKGSEISSHENESYLEISLTDSKGNKYQERSEYNMYDIYFDFSTPTVYWSRLDDGFSTPQELYDKGYREFEFDIKEPNSWNNGFGRNVYSEYRYKILSCKSSDGLPVGLLGSSQFGYQVDMVGEKLKADRNYMYFKLDELSLGTDSKIIIEIEGPRGIIKKLVICVMDNHKQSLLYTRISNLSWELLAVNNELEDIWSKEDQSKPRYAKEAWKVGLKAVFILGRVEEMKDQLKKVPGLKNTLSPLILAKLEDLMGAIKELEKTKEEKINKIYGFNL
jgi:hypothetical protein